VTMIRVKKKAQITLPSGIRRALGIEEGDYLEAELQGGKVVLTPKTVITKLPPVTLSERGEQMLREALEEVEAGKVKEHDTVESLIEELRHEADQD
jgi:AbrB family looped-hinge helix DNA binding protein